MKPVYLKLGIRVFGTMAGLLGISGLFFALGLFLPHAMSSGKMFGVVFAATILAVSAYESYVGYLVWFRWSPLAVQHVVGVLAFLVWAMASRYAFHRPSAAAPDWTLALPMVGLVVLLFCYRWLTAYWCRQLFPPVAPAAL